MWQIYRRVESSDTHATGGNIMKPHDTEFSYRFNQEHHQDLIRNAEQARQAEQLSHSTKRRSLLWTVYSTLVKRTSIQPGAVKPSTKVHSHTAELDYLVHKI